MIFLNTRIFVLFLTTLGLAIGGCGAKSSKGTGRTNSVDVVQDPASSGQEGAEDEVSQNEKPTSDDNRDSDSEISVVVEQKPEVRERPSNEDPGQDERTYEQVIPLPPTSGSQTYPSGDRYGDFGAVMFDDPMWYPGLPDYPAGHPRSKITQILTGGQSAGEGRVNAQNKPVGGYFFTDGKSDGLMANLVDHFNKIPQGKMVTTDYHPDVFSESLNLASRISNVQMDVDIYETSSFKLQIEFVDGPSSQPVRTQFFGKFDAQRRARLVQQDIVGDKDLKFDGIVECMDLDGGCQNVRIRVRQIKDGKVCRIAHLLYRFGDAHITMSESDRLHYQGVNNRSYQLMAEYLSNTAYNSCLVNKRRKDIPNRLTQHLLAYCGDARSHVKIPAADSIGLQVWAVAYGAAGFRVILKDKTSWGGSGDKTVVEGPLVYANMKSPMYSKRLKVNGRLSAYIKSAHLVNNDGGGNLNFEFRISGREDVEMRISVTSLIRKTTLSAKKPSVVPVQEEPRG